LWGRIPTLWHFTKRSVSGRKVFRSVSHHGQDSYEQFWGMLEDEDRNKLADIFKETFGDDVFVNFGKYYQAHKSDSY
ncbi:MAG: hypothetical protein J6X17_10510, partial [Lachnospiraceae bacterium]|nr:hypothetical protein [Lachnospiraceae bacterium]